MAVTTGNSRAETADWERRFRAHAIMLSAIAIDRPDVGLVTSNESGLAQLHRWDTRSDTLTPLTSEPGGRMMGKLSPDGRWACYLRDEHGNEIGHWVALSMDGGAEVDLTPGLAPYASEEFVFSRLGGRVAFATVSDDQFAIRVGELEEDGHLPDLRAIHHSASAIETLGLSADGRTLAASSAHRSAGLEYSILTFNVDSGDPGPELWDGAGTSVRVFAFAPGRDDHRLLATTNATGAERALVWDTASGARQDLPAGAPDGDILALDWSPDGRQVLLCQIRQAAQRLLLWDLASDVVRALEHPEGALLGYLRTQASYFRPDGAEIVCRLEDFAEPRRLIGLDPTTGRQTRTILAGGDVPPGRPLKSVTFPSGDGTTIQAWLGVPDGEPPFAVVLETHGGPTAATFANFNPQAQAFLDLGFAYLSVNYRGSTTFGREFEHAIWGRLGDLEIEDMAAAREWLIANGVGKADQILLTGWSYGGYLTLLGLGRQPELWAGGLAGVVVADWEMNYEDSSDILRAYQRMLFGGGPEERLEAYRKGSPLTYVDSVRAPLLIIQGRNDTRTPARPAARYVERLEERGHPVEIDWFDAGHMGGATDDEMAVAQMGRMLEFARRIVDPAT
jgi:dienelactone hydrolase/Tol biopolymer transport system component